MKKVIDTTGIFDIKDKGLLIIGINADLDPYPISYFDKYKDQELFFETIDGHLLKAKILGVKLTNSLIDKKNIGFLIPLQLKDLIKSNSSVYEP